jgi:hypothetical protein
MFVPAESGTHGFNKSLSCCKRVPRDGKCVQQGGEMRVESPNVPHQTERIVRRESTLGDRDLVGERSGDNLHLIVNHGVLIRHL